MPFPRSSAPPLALVPVLLPTLFAAGCATGPGGTPGSPATAPAAWPPALTQAEAARVFTGYRRAVDAARTRRDSALLEPVQADPLRAATAARLKVARRGSRPVARVPAARTRYLIPRTGDGAPRWFAVYAGGGGKRMHTVVFRHDPGSRSWKAVIAAELDGAAEPPPVALDRQGYAAVPEAGDAGRAVRPDEAAAAHAGYLDAATRSTPVEAAAVEATAGRVARAAVTARFRRPRLQPGPWTSQTAAGTRRSVAALAGMEWMATVTWRVGTAAPYALRTSDGGTVVWYALEQRVAATRVAPSGQGYWVRFEGDFAVLSRRRRFQDTASLVTSFQHLARVHPVSGKGEPGKGRMTVLGGAEQAVSISGT